MRLRLSYANVAATLALVIAVAGGGSAIAEPVANGAASVAQSVKQALKIGKQSNKRSKQALATANKARATARQALTRAGNTYTKDESNARYLLKAGVPLRSMDSDKLDGLDSSSFARATQVSSGQSSVLGPGTYDCTTDPVAPSMTVNVGPSGLVAVYAEAVIGAGSTAPTPEIRVQLYEPTALPSCETILSVTGTSTLVRQTLPGSAEGAEGRGSWLIYRVPEGERTFSLRYGHTGNGVGLPPLVSAPTLYVQPL